MNYMITPSEDGKYIIHTVYGETNREIVMPQILEAHALGRKLGINRYLFDATEARNADPPHESYAFAYKDMPGNEIIDRFACLAILVSPEDHSYDFVETVMKNAGLMVRIFTDPEEAKLYLSL